MPKRRTCVRTDGLDKEQAKELKTRIDKVVTDYNKEISEAELTESQTEAVAEE